MTHTKTQKTLVLGGTGKTGRRVAQRLRDLGTDVRIGSRTGQVPFDWGGRPPRDFTGYARRTAAAGVWDIPAANGADR